MDVFMNDLEFSDIEIFQHSGKVIPLFMTGHKNCLQAFVGTGPSSYKKRIYQAAVSQRLRNIALDAVARLRTVVTVANANADRRVQKNASWHAAICLEIDKHH
jgi:hypothetical protein